MEPPKPNPYESPAGVEPTRTPVKLWRWRLIPTAVVGLLGATSFIFGMVAVSIAIYVVGTRQNAVPIWLMAAACCLYLGVGAIWLFAASCFWRGKYRTAIALTVVGFVIPAVLISVVG